MSLLPEGTETGGDYDSIIQRSPRMNTDLYRFFLQSGGKTLEKGISKIATYGLRVMIV